MTNQIAIYARVSTNDQTVENQVNELRDYCKRKGYTIYKEYCDEGVSGAKSSRPALNSLMEDAMKRRFDAVLVWKLDRLGRSLSHLLKTLEEFKSRGIDFVAYNQNIDTTTPTGRLMFSMIGAFAEFERELIRERVKAGMERSREKGNHIGRPFTKVDNNKVHELRNQGLSIRNVAKELDITPSRVQYVLKCKGQEKV